MTLSRSIAPLVFAAGVAVLPGCATPPVKSARPQVSEADVRQARSHQSLGSNHLKDGRYALAIRELRAAAGLNPNDKWIRLGLGEAYRLKAMFPEAEHEVLEALAIDPEFQEAELTLSGLYIQMERYPDAITRAQKLIDDPTYPDVWAALTNKGYAQLQLGLLGDARHSLELAAEFNDNYWRAHLNLGILAAQQGDREEALARFAKVIKLGAGTPAEAEANYRVAEIFVSMGDRTQAMRHLIAATESNPGGTWGKLSADYLKRLQ
jgi:tetratricopeptide (TPR) repeat protein